MDYGHYLRRRERQGFNPSASNHVTERDQALRNLTVPIHSETAEASSSTSTSTMTGPSMTSSTRNLTSRFSLAPEATSVGYASLPANNTQEFIDVDDVNEETVQVTGGHNEDTIDIGMIIKKYHNVISTKHWVAKYGKTVSPRSGKRYTMARKCSACGKHTCCFCYQCGIPLCFSINNIGSQHSRKCFVHHVREHCIKST